MEDAQMLIPQQTRAPHFQGSGPYIEALALPDPRERFFPLLCSLFPTWQSSGIFFFQSFDNNLVQHQLENIIKPKYAPKAGLGVSFTLQISHR